MKLLPGTMSVEPTEDLAVVKQILTHPKAYRQMADDFSPGPEDLEIEPNPRISYLLVRRRNCAQPLGVFLVARRNPVVCEVHMCLLPRANWQPARQATALFLEQLWQTTSYMRAIGNIHEDNKAALRFSREFGFVEFGRNPQAIQKHGKLIAEIWVGISRPTS